jgi:hypothetical protein
MADGFESYWGSGIVKDETSHCRRLGDGLFIKRREMVMRLPTHFHILAALAPCSRNRPKPQYGRNALIRTGSFAGRFLPATPLALP